MAPSPSPNTAAPPLSDGVGSRQPRIIQGGMGVGVSSRQLDETGAPIYGPRDRIDTDAIAALARPFWLAGGYGTRGTG